MDKKLNEVTKVTDMAYVPVIMADGSIGQIAKSDLASVVAGVLGNPIGTMGQDLGNNIDLNTIVKSGLYSTLSSQNQPDGYEEWYGLLSVSKFRTGEVIQTWTPNGTSSNGLFERKKNYNSNAWSNWQRIDNYGYNSLAELAGGVGGMYYKGTFSNTKDCTETGVYYNDEGDAEDLPDNFGKQIMLTVIKCPSLFVQEVTSYITGGAYRRVVNLSLNDWGSWKRVDNV